ncbi:MAG: thioredoxin domain-containing protein [Chloroflexota bacterium]
MRCAAALIRLPRRARWRSRGRPSPSLRATPRASSLSSVERKAIRARATVGAFTRDNLKQYAAELKFDQAQFNQCLDSDRYATLVLDHLVEALQLKLPGTPTFLLNGRKIDAPTLDYTEFWKPLEAELKTR